VEDGMVLRELPELKEAMEVNHANTVIPLYTPNEPNRNFLIACTSADMALRQLFQLIVNAEQTSQESVLEAYINLTLQEPKTSKEIFDNFIAASEKIPEPLRNEKVDKSLLQRIGGVLPKGISGITQVYGISSIFGNGTGKDDFDTLKEAKHSDSQPLTGKHPKASVRYSSSYDTKKSYDDFVKNCITYGKMDQTPIDSPIFLKKKEDLLKKLKVVMKEAYNISGGYDDFARYLYKYVSNLKESYENMYNRYSIANRSKVLIGTEVFQSIGVQNKNDGLIRLYIEYNGKKTYLHFTRKPSFIVYMIYLLDKYRLDTEVCSIKISEHKSLFCKLFEMTYRESGETEFDKLTKKVLRGDSRPVHMSDCLSDIREVMKTTFSTLGISTERLPFIVPNEKSHLTVRKRNIKLDEKLEALALQTDEYP
jgi:hypothetical protein